MNEKLLTYIWFNKLYYEDQKTITGEEVRIISPGIPNSDAGPDVFNAKVKIGDKIWAGNVEFHVRASDWHRHGHDNNPLYSHLILHVVFEADEQILFESNAPIPTIILRYPDSILKGYEKLVNNKSFCPIDFSQIDSLHLHQWIDRLMIERLQCKVERINVILNKSHNDWEQAFYVVLTRAFGFGVNSDAMQSVAQSLPLNVIMHHRDDLNQLEALLLGQAGLLENITDPDEQEAVWIREYNFLKSKFSLHVIDGVYFKFLRMRPYAFPTMRLAQLAMLFHKYDNLFSRILENLELKSLYKLFDVGTTDYWNTHFKLNSLTEAHGTHLSKSSIDIIIINTIVPFIFRYSQISNDVELQSRAFSLLRQIKAESNHKTQCFIDKGFNCKDAYDSQALIQLYDHYCMNKDCLRCQFGHQYLKRI